MTEVPVPVVVLARDLTVPQQPARQSGRFGRNIQVVELEEASHWVLHEQPERATQRMWSI